MKGEEVDLLTELVQGLTQDVAELKQMLANQPKPTTLLDAKSSLEKVADAIKGLRGDISKQSTQAASTELGDISQQLQAIREVVRRSPANRITKGVQYGFGLLLISLLSLGILAYYATQWKSERNALADSDWKWRVVRQDAPIYAAQLDNAFAHDSAAYFQKRVVDLETADVARAAAEKATRQAKAMNAQADKLEGKSGSKRGKK